MAKIKSIESEDDEEIIGDANHPEMLRRGKGHDRVIDAGDSKSSAHRLRARQIGQYHDATRPIAIELGHRACEGLSLNHNGSPRPGQGRFTLNRLHSRRSFAWTIDGLLIPLDGHCWNRLNASNLVDTATAPCVTTTRV